jgi:hypothetical protein
MCLSFATLALSFGILFLAVALVLLIYLKVKKLDTKVERVLIIISFTGFVFSLLVEMEIIDVKFSVVKDCEIRLDSVCDRGFVKGLNITVLSISDAGVPMVQVATTNLNQLYPLVVGNSFDHSEFTIFCKRLLHDGTNIEGGVVDIYYRYGNRHFEALNWIFMLLSFVDLVFSSWLLMSKSNGKRKRGRR